MKFKGKIQLRDLSLEALSAHWAPTFQSHGIEVLSDSPRPKIKGECCWRSVPDKANASPKMGLIPENREFLCWLFWLPRQQWLDKKSKHTKSIVLTCYYMHNSHLCGHSSCSNPTKWHPHFNPKKQTKSMHREKSITVRDLREGRTPKTFLRHPANILHGKTKGHSCITTTSKREPLSSVYWGCPYQSNSEPFPGRGQDCRTHVAFKIMLSFVGIDFSPFK